MPADSREARHASHRQWRPLHPEVSARWRAAHPTQNTPLHRDSDAQRRYGIESYEELCRIRQQPCEICGKLANKMCMDHEGPSGTFTQSYRGVLCQPCTTRLGWYERFHLIIDEYLWRERRKRA